MRFILSFAYILVNTLYYGLAVARLSLCGSSLCTAIYYGVACAVKYCVPLGVNHPEGVVVAPEGVVGCLWVKYIVAEGKLIVRNVQLREQCRRKVGL